MKKFTALTLLVGLAMVSNAGADAFVAVPAVGVVEAPCEVCPPPPPAPAPCAQQVRCHPMERVCGPCGTSWCCPTVRGFLQYNPVL